METNPKDFFNIIFWTFTAVLALLTYRNAKKTLFNPIRSEMVKYQMKVLTEFIDNHISKGFSFDTSIDYSNLLKLNYDTDYLYDILTNERKFENHQFDEVDKGRLSFCQENLGGLFEVSKNQGKITLDNTLYGDFDITKQYVQTKFIKDKEQNNTDLDLQRFYLTKKFNTLYTDLINLQTNPFIPDEIKADIKTLISSIYKNISILYELLSINISQQTHTTYQILYSEFLEKKIDHQKNLEKLRNNVSKYFQVNRI